MDGEIVGTQMSKRQQDMRLVEDAVAAAIPLAEPGYVFTKSWLQEQLDLGPEPPDTRSHKRWQTRYMDLIDMWREAMGKQHIATETTWGEGYKVLAQSDATAVYSREMFRSMRKALKQGHERMGVWIDPNALTPRQRQERIDAMGRVALLEHAVRQSRPRPPKMPVARPLQALPQPEDRAE